AICLQRHPDPETVAIDRRDPRQFFLELGLCLDDRSQDQHLGLAESRRSGTLLPFLRPGVTTCDQEAAHHFARCGVAAEEVGIGVQPTFDGGCLYPELLADAGIAHQREYRVGGDSKAALGGPSEVPDGAALGQGDLEADLVAAAELVEQLGGGAARPYIVVAGAE